MITTLSFPLELSEDETSFIKNLQRVQSSMIRSAFSLTQQNLKEKEIRAELKGRFDKKSKFVALSKL